MLRLTCIEQWDGFNCNLDIQDLFIILLTMYLFVYKGNRIDRRWKVGLHLVGRKRGGESSV